MLLFMKEEWKSKITQEFTGICRNPEEMSERVEFHAKLTTRGRVYIPKTIVERWMLRKDTLIRVRVLLRGGFRSVEFIPGCGLASAS